MLMNEQMLTQHKCVYIYVYMLAIGRSFESEVNIAVIHYILLINIMGVLLS